MMAETGLFCSLRGCGLPLTLANKKRNRDRRPTYTCARGHVRKTCNECGKQGEAKNFSRHVCKVAAGSRKQQRGKDRLAHTRQPRRASSKARTRYRVPVPRRERSTSSDSGSVGSAATFSSDSEDSSTCDYPMPRPYRVAAPMASSGSHLPAAGSSAPTGSTGGSGSPLVGSAPLAATMATIGEHDAFDTFLDSNSLDGLLAGLSAPVALSGHDAPSDILLENDEALAGFSARTSAAMPDHSLLDDAALDDILREASLLDVGDDALADVDLLDAFDDDPKERRVRPRLSEAGRGESDTAAAVAVAMHGAASITACGAPAGAAAAAPPSMPMPSATDFASSVHVARGNHTMVHMPTVAPAAAAAGGGPAPALPGSMGSSALGLPMNIKPSGFDWLRGRVSVYMGMFFMFYAVTFVLQAGLFGVDSAAGAAPARAATLPNMHSSTVPTPYDAAATADSAMQRERADSYGGGEEDEAMGAFAASADVVEGAPAQNSKEAAADADGAAMAGAAGAAEAAPSAPSPRLFDTAAHQGQAQHRPLKKHEGRGSVPPIGAAVAGTPVAESYSAQSATSSLGVIVSLCVSGVAALVMSVTTVTVYRHRATLFRSCRRRSRFPAPAPVPVV